MSTLHITNHPDRINYLTSIFNEGGVEQARITEKSRTGFWYITELEDVGNCYIMDDFGNAVVLTDELFFQWASVSIPMLT